MHAHQKTKSTKLTKNSTGDDKNCFRPELTVKKLRYYARFVVVCLLLKKMKLVRDLIRELQRQVDDYIATYNPEDQLEWQLVLTEIKQFVEVPRFAKP